MSLPHRRVGWTHDLPYLKAPLNRQSLHGKLDPPPNTIDCNYLEIPRSLLPARGISFVLGSISILACMLLPMFLIYLCLSTSYTPDFEEFSITVVIVVTALFTMTPYIRADLELPRDEPIRFNRHRRKVYFYQYRMDRLHPFGRKNWGVQPIAYNWEDLTAEVYRIYVPTAGLKEEIMISVRKPGSDKVIDRVFLTSNPEKGQLYWELAQHFMEHGLEGLPHFEHEPWAWNEGTYSNPFEQRAPKVKWPAEMDLESRSAPGGDEQ